MKPLSDLIAPFIKSLSKGEITIYNEFSVQHELGIFLRAKWPEYKVQFERNVSFFFTDVSSFTKREIDVVVFPSGMKNRVRS